MQTWYGWIPTIVPKLLRSYYFKQLERGLRARPPLLIDVENNDFIIRDQMPDTTHINWRDEFPHIYRLAIRNVLKCEPDWKVYFSLRIFADDPTNNSSIRRLKRTAFALDKNNVIRATVILSQPENMTAEIDPQNASPEGLDVDSMAEIKVLEPQGLVHYIPRLIKVSDLGAEADMEIISRYHYELVRDFYHEHVFHHGGDFLLQPVQADTREDALERICNQYVEMTTDIHRKIKMIIDHFSDLVWCSNRRVLIGERFALHARGNLEWCAQFHKLFADSGHENCVENNRSFEAASRSLALLQSDLVSAARGKTIAIAELYVVILTYVVIFLTTLIAINETPWFETLGLWCRLGIAGIGAPVATYSMFMYIIIRSHARKASMPDEESDHTST